MRFILIPLLLLVSACGRGEEATENGVADVTPESTAQMLLAGAGRDRMCVKGERAGFVTYAASGDANCTVRGAATQSGDTLRITPDGETACTIDARREGSGFVLGPLNPSCAYYCGPNASFAGKSFTAQNDASPAVDLAGDPLC